jgi:hypothetical protein
MATLLVEVQYAQQTAVARIPKRRFQEHASGDDFFSIGSEKRHVHCRAALRCFALERELSGSSDHVPHHSLAIVSGQHGPAPIRAEGNVVDGCAAARIHKLRRADLLPVPDRGAGAAARVDQARAIGRELHVAEQG